MEGRQVFVIVIVALSGFTAIAIRLIGAWAKSRGGKVPSTPDASRLDSQLEALQQSVDAIALEVERIAEGQRFTTKLLSERSAERIDRPR